VRSSTHVMLALLVDVGVAHRTTVVPGGPSPESAALTNGGKTPSGGASGTADVTVDESLHPADVHTRRVATSVNPGERTFRLQLVIRPVHTAAGEGSVPLPGAARWNASSV
jgi:hypothetical protein